MSRCHSHHDAFQLRDTAIAEERLGEQDERGCEREHERRTPLAVEHRVANHGEGEEPDPDGREEDERPGVPLGDLRHVDVGKR